MTKKIRLVLAGTGKFSAQVFRQLINDSRFEIICLISQPNKKLDRNKQPIMTDVAKLAREFSISLYQPNKISEILEDLKKVEFDFFMTAAFGQFIPNSILALPKCLPLNVHGSLLEKYRGASPIQYALLNDDKVTGITLIEMVAKMDAGDMLKKAVVEIKPTDTALELFDKLGKITAENISQWLIDIYNGNFIREVQDESKVTLAPKIQNEEAQLFADDSCQDALNKIRAFNDQPGAFMMYREKRLKIYRASKEKIKTPLVIDFKDGKLYLQEYQFEGKKKVTHEV
ncbi:methionyl-tRNA formyltransferase [Mycoplasma phocoeninasale]|uniref:methionyl-tRNA formyltransferase n=1 Tax=Mycoplasma phocoeninasale TaxID=2726117 RepID=UPI0019678E86|nr:methionyl-tRNA formyltransferase [Mycoplasma phocoeninasale]MBN0970463.1 methionyl-tRNA formyltransferase [Mycoplasma phocoeninasale]